MGNFVNRLDQRMQLTDKKRYRREQYQSFMTAPEWRNVEMAEEYAQHIREGKSIFHFPYFRQIFDLWRIIYNAYSVARRYNSISDIVFSEYMLMDLFIGVFTTMELIPKGLISLFIAPFVNKEHKSVMQEHIAAEYYEKYAAGLQTIPFYDHKYAEILESLTQKYKTIEKPSWADWLTWKVVSWELWARKWISKPLSSWFHQEDNLVPPTTDILVKFDAVNAINPEHAKQLFSEKLTKISEKHAVQIVDQHLYAKEVPKTKDGRTYTSVYARLSVPRYAAFQDLVYALSGEGIHLRKIAGQERVQVKCAIKTASEETLIAKEKALKQTPDAIPLYGYKDRIHANQEILLFDVPVKNLDATLNRFKEQEDVTVNFIHNF